MKKLLMILVLGTLTLQVSACNISPGSETKLADGQKEYEVTCAPCHSASASHGIDVGECMASDIRAQTIQVRYRNDIDLFKRAILDGKDEDGNVLDTMMPRWRNTISDTEVTVIIGYLETLH